MLITILTDGIQAYFTDTSMQPENCPPTFHKLIKDQTAIGGRQLFHGGFATEWQRLQNQHLRRNGIQSAIKASLQSAQALAVDTAWVAWAIILNISLRRQNVRPDHEYLHDSIPGTTATEAADDDYGRHPPLCAQSLSTLYKLSTRATAIAPIISHHP
jgi:hypothetical protein